MPTLNNMVKPGGFHCFYYEDFPSKGKKSHLPTTSFVEYLLQDIQDFFKPLSIGSSSSFLKESVWSNLFLQVKSKIWSYLSYERDWDGYGGVTPTKSAVANAIDFLIKLPKRAVLPRPGLAGDGEVGLFWKSGSLFIDVGFLGDDTYSFYARDKHGNEYYGDELPLKQDLPVELLRTIPTRE